MNRERQRRLLFEDFGSPLTTSTPSTKSSRSSTRSKEQARRSSSTVFGNGERTGAAEIFGLDSSSLEFDSRDWEQRGKLINRTFVANRREKPTPKTRDRTNIEAGRRDRGAVNHPAPEGSFTRRNISPKKTFPFESEES